MLSAPNNELHPFVQSTSVNTCSMTTCSPSFDDNVMRSERYGTIASPPLRKNTSSTSSTPQSSMSIGVNLRVTGQCSQGGRKYMEDYFSVAYQQSENTKDLEYAFVGIYDGHGGAEAATFAKEHLMMEIVNQKLFWSDSDQDVLRAIREGYIATHYAMWREQDKWPQTSSGLPSTAGTTATVAFIRREKIYIGHVGDSGVVLGYQNDNEDIWRAKPLTTDHKPESKEEQARIQRSGGKVVVKSGVPRVVWKRPRAGHKGPIRRNTPVDEIPFLAVARSLGDLWSYNSARNEFIVSPDPDVKVIKINPKTFKCLIFGTDGLWNVVSAQAAVNCVFEKETLNERLHARGQYNTVEGSHGQWNNPSKVLVEKALRTWSARKMRADNTSVVTVIFYPPGTNIEDDSPRCHTQSYGLEYTQVNGEVLAQDDSTTYAELANKYLPPEEYRNFRYDDDEEVEPEKELAVGMLRGHDCSPYAAEDYNTFQEARIRTEDGHSYYNPLCMSHISRSESDTEINVVDFDEDDDGYGRKRYNNNIETLKSITTYQLEETPHCSRENKSRMHSESLLEESVEYMNSFAESYTDSLLGAHVKETINDIRVGKSNGNHCRNSTSPSNSSSNASFHSAVYQHDQKQQHELLREHQLYQAQCMSEEEGYSLTKLETRGEQQMRNGNCGSTARNVVAKDVPAFQIFRQHQQQSTITLATIYEEQNGVASIDYGGGTLTRKNPPVWDPRYPAHSRFVSSYEAPKLELNSLLQQEREEERQVAMERMAMQRRVEQEAEPQHQRQNDKSMEDNYHTEYLEEEIITEAFEDTSIQINEITSSSTDSPMMSEQEEEEELQPMEVDEVVEDAAQGVAGFHQTPLSSSSKNNIVLIEKIEILKDKPELVIECERKPSINTPQLPLQPPTSRSRILRSRESCASSSKQPVKILINPSPSKRTHYPNVPNENQRRASLLPLPPTSSKTLRHCSSSPYGTLLQQRTDARQLRSMAPLNTVDYSKRMLRSRNSLSKELIARTTLSPRRSNSQYMRTTAATLLATTNPTPTHNAAHKTATRHVPPSSLQRNTKVTAVASASKAPTPPSRAINLRSRQILTLAPPTPSVAASSLAGSSEKRNLRSLTAKPQTINLRNNLRNSKEAKASVSTGTFSKATRLQSTAASWVAPPRSPKLISAANRARSLMPSQIASDFDKRSTLRSGALSKSTAAATPSTLQTRRRVQKQMSR